MAGDMLGTRGARVTRVEPTGLILSEVGFDASGQPILMERSLAMPSAAPQ